MSIPTDNSTVNQHFISRFEQRSNALNPGAKPANQRLYEFEIIDRETRWLRLTNDAGRRIGTNLSFLDLFSFDVDSASGSRGNFEQLFERYEASIPSLTDSVLHPPLGVTHEALSNQVYQLFVAKLMSFIRNPYCVAKMLNTFGALATVHTTDPLIYSVYERILRGRKPQQRYLCEALDITDEQYGAWLRVIFMLLQPWSSGANALDRSLHTLFFARDKYTFANIYLYDSERCMLCDRGYSTALPQERGLLFDFNLNSNAFIRYGVFDFDAFSVPPPWIVESIMRGPKQVFINRFTNDMPMLAIFHQRIVDQAHSRVFCSGRSPHGVIVRNEENQAVT